MRKKVFCLLGNLYILRIDLDVTLFSPKEMQRKLITGKKEVSFLYIPVSTYHRASILGKLPGYVHAEREKRNT